MKHGDCMYGTCEHCGKEAPLFRRKREFKDIKCDCHSPNHFDLLLLCEECNKLDNNEVFEPYTIYRKGFNDIKLIV